MRPSRCWTIVVTDPGPGEVLVAVQACGVCHTDLHYREGAITDDFPFLLGHEAAGAIEAVGEDVTDLRPGDSVVLAWWAPCGSCRSCRRGRLGCAAADAHHVQPVVGGGHLLRHGTGPDRPDLMFHYGSVPFDMNTARWGYPTSENAFCLTLAGRVPNSSPGRTAKTDDELFDYIRKTHNTVYHPSCTVRMGADDDPSAPLDAWLGVKGVEGLRVADGSVMPDLVTVNPCITTMMIGEKCADLIKGTTKQAS